jgi:hypothetical protein
VDINAGGTRIKGDMRRGVKSAVGTERWERLRALTNSPIDLDPVTGLRG